MFILLAHREHSSFFRIPSKDLVKFDNSTLRLRLETIGKGHEFPTDNIISSIHNVQLHFVVSHLSTERLGCARERDMLLLGN